MKKLLFGCILAVVGGLAIPQVTANDFCCPDPGYDQCCYETGFEGFYIGGNLGVLTHTAHRNDLDGFLTDNAGWTRMSTNFTAGLQLGYDWQCCEALLGLVVDWNWVNIDHRLHDNPNADDGNYINSEFNWFTTIRARAGAVINETLLYITGGAAVSKHETTWADLPSSFNFNHTRWGWVGGFGAEFNLGCNWSLGAEFLFLQFSNRNRTFTDGTGTFTFGHSDSAWVGRILLNYRFGDLCSLW